MNVREIPEAIAHDLDTSEWRRFDLDPVLRMRNYYRAEKKWGRGAGNDIQDAFRDHRLQFGGHGHAMRMSKCLAIVATDQTWRIPMGAIILDVAETFENSLAEAEKAQERLAESIKAFRSSANNDLASIRSLAERISKEVDGCTRVLQRATDMMASPEMQAAVANARALVEALTALQEVKGAKLTLCVIDQKVGEK